jgi:hypothetical protein
LFCGGWAGFVGSARASATLLERDCPHPSYFWIATIIWFNTWQNPARTSYFWIVNIIWHESRS